MVAISRTTFQILVDFFDRLVEAGTWNESAVITAIAVRQLAVLFVARMQVFLVELFVVIIVVAALNRPASQFGRLEGTELQFVVEVKRWWTALMIGLEGAAEVELFARCWVSVKAVRLRTLEYIFVIGLDLFVRVTWFDWF